MTRVLYAIAQWCLGVLPVDSGGRRCFDETLADWRSEAASAHGPTRLAVTARAMWSVARCLVMISFREARSREGLTLLRRLALWSAATVLASVLFNWNRSIPVAGIPTAIGSTAVWLGVSGVVALMPLLAFVSAAWGRRSASTAPRLGPALVAALVMLGAMGWAMPAANQAWREAIFGLLGGQGSPAPGMNERFLTELVGWLATPDFSRAVFALNLRLVFIVAVPVLLVLGLTARSLTGRWRLAATVLPPVVFAVPFLARIDSDYGYASAWPAMLVAVLITRTLARGQERAHLRTGVTN